MSVRVSPMQLNTVKSDAVSAKTASFPTLKFACYQIIVYLCTVKNKSSKNTGIRPSRSCWPTNNKKNMKRLLLLSLLFMSVAALSSAHDYNVRDYGAKGDGKTLDHVAVNQAIEACVAGGGGRVVLPAGTYLCGSIRMKSNVELHLTAGGKDPGSTCGVEGIRRERGVWCA